MNAFAERAPCAAFAREQPETNVRVFHSDLRTDKDADLPSSAGPSGVRPAALALGNAPGGDRKIYNSIFAGNSSELLTSGPSPVGVTWNGIATSNFAASSFQNPTGTLVLKDLSAIGTAAWFPDPTAVVSGQTVPVPGVFRSEAHVKPLPQLMGQAVALPITEGYTALNLFEEPRTASPDTLKDIGADESWLYRVWAIQDPNLANSSYQPGTSTCFIRGTAPFQGATVLGVDTYGLTNPISTASRTYAFDPTGVLSLPSWPINFGAIAQVNFSTFSMIPENPQHAYAQVQLVVPPVTIPGLFVPGQLFIFQSVVGSTTNIWFSTNAQIFFLAE